MIDPVELAICRRRGHDDKLFPLRGWAQCRWCGMWLREVRTFEEREDTPPEDEQNGLDVLRKKLNPPAA